MLLVLISMIQNTSLPLLEDLPEKISLTSWKMRFFQSVKSSNDRKIALYRVFLFFFVIQNRSYTTISFEGGDFFPFFYRFSPIFGEETSTLVNFFLKTPQILKPGVGPAIHIFLQVEIIFEDSIILMFTLWFWDQRNLSNVMISPVSHISVRIVPETVPGFFAVRIGVFFTFFPDHYIKSRTGLPHLLISTSIAVE